MEKKTDEKAEERQPPHFTRLTGADARGTKGPSLREIFPWDSATTWFACPFLDGSINT